MDSIRDSVVGQILRHYLPSRLRYPEETQNTETLNTQLHRNNEVFTSVSSTTFTSDIECTSRQDQAQPSNTPNTTDPILCGWYSDDDLANPHNWSAIKKFLAIGNVSACTIVVYMTGPIFAPSQEHFMTEYGTSHEYTVLGLSLFA